MNEAAYFNVTLEQAGTEGDAIVVTADNPDAEITIYLIQKRLNEWEPSIRRISTTGVLSLDGVDFLKARAENDYSLVIASTEETTFTLSFTGNWSSGVDYFDYSRTGSISPLAAGNNSIDKAGNYGGLVTCAGDKDFYKVLSVYANTIDVTVKGTGLAVQEFDIDGNLLQIAVEENGLYKLTVAKDNYVCVEGTADITANECDPYTLSITDTAQTYLKAELTAMLPEKPVVTGELKSNQVIISVCVEDGLQAFYSNDMYSWSEYADGLVADENGRYFFKAVDAESGLESQYTSLLVEGIDHEHPVIVNVAASPGAPTNADVVVTAEFMDDTAVDKALYRIGLDGEWLDYEDGVTVSENTTVYFKAVDMVGNESEIVSCEVSNIDKIAPIIELAGDNTTPLRVTTLTASTEAGLDIFYSLDQENWMTYEAPLDVTENGTYYFKATDAAGNTETADYVFTNILPASDVAPLSLTWEAGGDAAQYIVEYSADDFEHVVRFTVDSNALDSFQLPAGSGGCASNLQAPMNGPLSSLWRPRRVMSNRSSSDRRQTAHRTCSLSIPSGHGRKAISHSTRDPSTTGTAPGNMPRSGERTSSPTSSKVLPTQTSC